MAHIETYLGKAPATAGSGLVWLAVNCSLVGDVRLDASVSVWHGAVLRADNGPIEIGCGSNIQDNAVLHVDPGYPIKIGSKVSIGHGAILHGCTVSSGTVVGMGAIIMNGAVIGRDCIVAAGAIVLEHAVFPDGSLIVGSPAIRKRELTHDARSKLQAGANRYQEKAKLLLKPWSDKVQRTEI
jgi:carbonic anhydrase/acetyltransferase-like protein (isoleucine patch superfamily)